MSGAEAQIIVFDSIEMVRSRAEEFCLLVEEALGVRQSIDDTLRQINFINGDSVIVASAVAGELAAMNAFIGQTFMSGGAAIPAYQSGFSATRNKHRGKGLWAKLLAACEDILGEMGGKWIYGYPNPVSYPLFAKKLGYTTIDMYARRLPAILLHTLPKHVRDDTVVRPDLQQLILWKVEYDPGKYLATTSGELSSIATVKKKFGLSLLDIGAWHSDELSLRDTLAEISRSRRTAFVRIEVSENSQYFDALKMRDKSRPLVIKEIGDGTVPSRADFFGGLADNY
ncbi:GNAT family N-acetyltransferase [Leptolyngbya sp. 15MV]|nr:GNAT family N-acetyltransferase [Leptolyngbya sp. 15MV]